MAALETTRHQPARVVHPLFDEPEGKMDLDALPPMPMTQSLRFSLVALRAYLMVMVLMVTYRFPELASILGRRAW
jgi:hypothetical protein